MLTFARSFNVRRSNKRRLFSDHFPIKSGVYSFPADNGPSFPVVFDVGDTVALHKHNSPNAKAGTEAGTCHKGPAKE
ncbi:unnamed protein product [Clavelina lepadiformis]|uniref:Uncharacterized protein n=1 Tax=Clavelina lepadiformis TaxID=159417 RepID=A0ABP0G668_CLALP